MKNTGSSRWVQLNDQIINCRLCPRLVAWREQIALQKRRMYQDWVYWGKPVTGFGDHTARLIILGLAPGAHGSNRTGRMFTGDSSGDFLFSALYRHGFASRPDALRRTDGLRLKDVFITAVCRCVPPGNKPLPAEIQNCRPFLLKEMVYLEGIQGIVALGYVAFTQAIRLCHQLYKINWDQSVKFAHGVFLRPATDASPWVLGSYHPSRQNTQTGRLTEGMFDEVWLMAKRLLVSNTLIRLKK